MLMSSWNINGLHVEDKITRFSVNTKLYFKQFTDQKSDFSKPG